MSSPEKNILYNAARNHIRAGRSIIPLKISYNKEQKKLVKPSVPWKKFQKELATETEVQTWFEQKKCTHLGMVLGAVSGNIWVLDADGPAAVMWMADNAPATSVYAQTRRGVHAYYRMPEGIAVKCDVDIIPGMKESTGDQIDVKGVGGIATIPPSPHVDGRYEWKNEDWDNLTVWAPPEKEKQSKREKENINFGTTPEGMRNSRLASLVGELFNSGYGFEYVLNWGHDWNDNTCVPPMDRDEVERTVKSIFDIHSKKTGGISATVVEDIEIAEFEDEDESTEFLAPSERILKPGGMLGKMMQFIENRAYQPSPPVFALTASMVMLGTLVGQKVMTETGLRTNLYIVALADSGVGKNLPMMALEQLLVEAGVDNFLGPKRFASDAALISAITNYDSPNQKALMLFIDEIGDLFGVIKGQKVAARVETLTLMKELYSCTGSMYSKAFADTDKNASVYGPHLSFYGTGVPLRFWEIITYHDVIDGFVARCLIITDESEIRKGGIPKTLSAPSDLIKLVQTLADIPARTIGNIAARPAPTMVSKNAEALELFDTWQNIIIEQQNKHRKNKKGKGAIYNRMAEHASKIALIHAISLAKEIPEVVGLESMQYAIDFMDWYISPSNANLNNIREGNNDELQRSVMEMLAEGKAVYQGQIINAFRRKYSKKLIMESLEMLEESRKIELVEKPRDMNGGRPAYLWRKVLK